MKHDDVVVCAARDSMQRARLALLISLIVVPARADELPAPDLAWTILQLVPSPGITVASKGGAAYTMRWELTPVLRAFGVRREVMPWRTLVVEPMVRYGGSLELFVAGEYTGRGAFADRWGVRTGLRLYLPLVQHGENVALSIGGAHVYAGGEHGIGIEAGGYVLYGVLGLQVTYAPPLGAGESVTVNLSVRYF